MIKSPAKSPVAMLQEKTAPTPARTPHTLRVADIVRAYIPQVGYYLFSYFDMIYVFTGMYEESKKAQHGTAAQQKQRK